MRRKRKVQHNNVQTTRTPDDLIIADVYEETHEAKDIKVGVDVFKETYSAVPRTWRLALMCTRTEGNPVGMSAKSSSLQIIII